MTDPYDSRIRALENTVAVLVSNVGRADSDARDFREEIRAAMRRADEQAERRDRETKELLARQAAREDKRDREREQERKDRETEKDGNKWRRIQQGTQTVSVFLVALGLVLTQILH